MIFKKKLAIANNLNKGRGGEFVLIMEFKPGEKALLEFRGTISYNEQWEVSES